MKQFVIGCMIWIAIVSFPTLVTAQEDEPDINAFVFVDKEPVPLNISDIRKEIGYPEEAIENAMEGTVIARVLVGKDGKYIRHKVIKEIHPALAKAVSVQVPNLNFSPAVLGGENIYYWMNIPFQFKLVDEREEMLKKNVAELTEKLAVEGKNYELWHRRGIQRSQLGDIDDAIVDYTESINLNPRKNKKKAEKNTYPYLIYAYYGRGNAYASQEKLDEAISDYNQAIQLASEIAISDSGINATLSDIYLERGYVFNAKDDLGAAKSDLKWILENDPEKKCEIYPMLADIGLEENNYSELVSVYKGLVDCKPEDELRKYSLGYYQAHAGDYEDAIVNLGYVFENTKSLALKLAASVRMGWANMKMEKFEEAHAAIQKGLDINVLNPQSYYYKGLVYQAEGKEVEMCEVFEKAIIYGLEGEEVQKIEEMQATACSKE